MIQALNSGTAMSFLRPCGGVVTFPGHVIATLCGHAPIEGDANERGGVMIGHVTPSKIAAREPDEKRRLCTGPRDEVAEVSALDVLVQAITPPMRGDVGSPKSFSRQEARHGAIVAARSFESGSLAWWKPGQTTTADEVLAVTDAHAIEWYVGEWHTHDCELTATASREDIGVALAQFERGQCPTDGAVLSAIVSRTHLYVFEANARGAYALTPAHGAGLMPAVSYWANQCSMASKAIVG